MSSLVVVAGSAGSAPPLLPRVRRGVAVGVVVASVAIEKTEETAGVLTPNSRGWDTRTPRRLLPTIRVPSALQRLLAGLLLTDAPPVVAGKD